MRTKVTTVTYFFSPLDSNETNRHDTDSKNILTAFRKKEEHRKVYIQRHSTARLLYLGWRGARWHRTVGWD